MLSKASVHGLVLAGGLSERMGVDKGSIVYPKLSKMPQRVNHFSLLKKCGLECYLSCREEQQPNETLFQEKIIFDRKDLHGGPGVGILSAHLFRPDVAWLVLACDFPFVSESAIQDLLLAYAQNEKSIGYRHEDGTIEPLFAIWSPVELRYFHQRFLAGNKSPRRALEENLVQSMNPRENIWLQNINSPAERAAYPELLE